MKKGYSEFLGFKLKAVRKAEKYVVKSHMADKAIKKVTEKLKKQIHEIRHSKDKTDRIIKVRFYNSMVFGIHNYYRYATHISYDCRVLYHHIRHFLRNQLRRLIQNKGTIRQKDVAQNYGKSKLIIYINNQALIPVSYIQTKRPMYKRVKICKYTPEGREAIHKSLKFDESVIAVMHLLAKSYIPGRSIEYTDNRVSLYAAQYGKCAVTGKILWVDEIHCHHKRPVSQGGTDEYTNLVIVHEDVHRLIHAAKQETITAYLKMLNLSQSQIDKLNKFRILAGNPAI